MPAIKCNNNKWKWGEKGKCIYDTKSAAEKAGVAIEISKITNKK